MLSKYQVASQWLESAMFESLKTENVDLNKFLSDLEACAQNVHELVSMEINPIRLAALHQLSSTLRHQRSVLLAKRRQLERASSGTCEGRQIMDRGNVPVGRNLFNDGKESHAKRRLSAIKDTIVQETGMSFDSVVGLDQAKQSLREAIILPVKYPHLFTGGRYPWKRVLLYGPPGTGKTRLAQAVSGELESTFYCVSSSDLISSWVGESEKIIRDLFQDAREVQGKSIIFIDEIDSVCRVRCANEEEHTRRVKTELLRQMDGANMSAVGHSSNSVQLGDVFLVCATNCPWELDPAFLRRFQRRIYIPLPGRVARRQMFALHLGTASTDLSDSNWEHLLTHTKGYSGSDISTCVADALLEPVRELEHASHWTKKYGSGDDVPVTAPQSGCGFMYVSCGELEPGAERMAISDLPHHLISLRPLCLQDFTKALERSHRTVTEDDLYKYDQFTSKYGQTG